MPTKAFFLDRDGVINEEVGSLSQVADFSMYSFAPEAIKKIHEAGYLAIIITNQPMIAKGFMSEQDLSKIHNRMETELAKGGAKLDAIYYCPHHPEKGFKGERPELKVICECRKPGIELITRAVKDFNIDLSKSFFIGDSTTDAGVAETAKIKFVGVNTGYALKDSKYSLAKKYVIYKNLLEAVNETIKNV